MSMREKDSLEEILGKEILQDVMVTDGESVYYGRALGSKMKTESFPLHYPQKKVGYDFK